jgi:hypothetical protein
VKRITITVETLQGQSSVHKPSLLRLYCNLTDFSLAQVELLVSGVLRLLLGLCLLQIDEGGVQATGWQ